MSGVTPNMLHNAGVKYRAQLEAECLFITYWLADGFSFYLW